MNEHDNTNIEPYNHKEQRFFEVIQNEILQPKDEKGADDAKKVHVLCELFFQQF